MQVKSCNKNDNVRKEPKNWNDSTRTKIYTPCYKNGRAKAFPGHKKNSFFVLFKYSTHLHFCVSACATQITMVHVHNLTEDKKKEKKNNYVDVYEKFIAMFYIKVALKVKYRSIHQPHRWIHSTEHIH